MLDFLIRLVCERGLHRESLHSGSSLARGTTVVPWGRVQHWCELPMSNVQQPSKPASPSTPNLHNPSHKAHKAGSSESYRSTYVRQ